MAGKIYDMVIIGGGISGLSMAHFCVTRGLRTLLLEKEAQTGGALCSARFPEAGQFWLEMGAHSCFSSYGTLVDILAARGLLDKILKRQNVHFRMWVEGQIKSIPSQLRIIELLRSLPRLLTQRKEDQSVAEYFSKIVGRRNFENVFSPAFNAVICQPANDFPAEMLFRKKPRRRGVQRSFTLPGGLQTIADTLAAIPDLELQTAHEVTAITVEKNGFQVKTCQDNQYQTQFLTLATPVSVSAQLLQNVYPEIAELLQPVKTTAVESVGVVVQKKHIYLPPLAGLIAVQDDFYSMVSRDIITDDHYRGFTFHLKPAALDETAKLQKISEVLKVAVGSWTASAAKTNLLPAPVVGHANIIQQLDTRLAGKPLALTGNYFSGVSIEDCASRSFSEFSRLFASSFKMV